MRARLVLASFILCLQSACGLWGTNTGNPGADKLQTNLPVQGSQADLLAWGLCSKIAECFGLAKMSPCYNQVITAPGFPEALGPGAGKYSTLQDLGGAELSQRILVNAELGKICRRSIEALDCSSKPVMDSYQLEFPDAYGEAHHLLKSNADCQQIFLDLAVLNFRRCAIDREKISSPSQSWGFSSAC